MATITIPTNNETSSLWKRRRSFASNSKVRQFKTRTEQVEWYEKQFGWSPLTEEDKVAIDDAVRMVTNFN